MFTGGTHVVGVTSTADPVRTAVLDLDLEPGPAGTLARLLAGFLGWSGKRPELARALNLTDAALRTSLDALEAAGLAVRERFNIEGRWVYALAITDTPGRLPSRAELRGIFQTSTKNARSHAPAAPLHQAARSRNASLDLTSKDSVNPQVPTSGGNQPVNRFPLQGTNTRTDEPVNRLSAVPESAEVRAHHARTPRSVISSMAELEALARMRGCRPIDGGRFRTSREVRDVARTLDQVLVDDGLALLGRLGLPFWVAPEVWALMVRGWSVDEVAAELDGVDAAKSPHSAARYRLARAAARPDAPAQVVDEDLAEEPARPLGLDELVARDANHAIPSWGDQAGEDWPPHDPADTDPGAAPWDRAAAERARQTYGWRAPAVPEYDDMDAVRARQAAIRAESGDLAMTPGYGRYMVNLIKAGRHGDWSSLNDAVSHP